MVSRRTTTHVVRLALPLLRSIDLAAISPKSPFIGFDLLHLLYVMGHALEGDMCTPGTCIFIRKTVRRCLYEKTVVESTFDLNDFLLYIGDLCSQYTQETISELVFTSLGEVTDLSENR